ncbi:hypothetical protein FE783_37180 [Paenibacillus mesophilus]|uniref:hypothetical protein n=1 Tax=Paenibacillus mesophilus TaxID=2582849 RepID=UPI00110DBF91|nr:hypothetical protein [Paenibacillus mesophilus]TMV42540.1 hypothetical protein FE783_37180 [Paenibacillus mesophilus]
MLAESISKPNVYQEIAIAALGSYSIGDSQLEYLGQRDHATLKVETDAEVYLIKIHKDNLAGSTIKSEMQWLEALSSDTKLIVPKPVRNKKDCLVTEWERNKNNYLVTLHHWVEGVVLNRQPTSAEVIRLSGIMAFLHEHSINWKLPQGFDRPVYDMESLQSYLPKLLVLQGSGTIDKIDYDSIEETVN